MVCDPDTGLPLWLVSELAWGSLRTWVRKRRAECGGLDLQSVFDIAADVLQGLQFIHTKAPKVGVGVGDGG